MMVVFFKLSLPTELIYHIHFFPPKTALNNNGNLFIRDYNAANIELSRTMTHIALLSTASRLKSIIEDIVIALFSTQISECSMGVLVGFVAASASWLGMHFPGVQTCFLNIARQPAICASSSRDVFGNKRPSPATKSTVCSSTRMEARNIYILGPRKGYTAYVERGEVFPALGQIPIPDKRSVANAVQYFFQNSFSHKSQIATRILCFSSERIFLETPIESQCSGLSETLSVELELVLDVDRVTEFWTAPQTCLQVY